MQKANVTLKPMEPCDRQQFILDNQRAFKFGAIQSGYEFSTGEDEIITPPEIEEAMNAEGAETYRIMDGAKKVGGIILRINRHTHHNTLVLFFALPEEEGRGVGYGAWCEVEKLHPETEMWDTCTPYFDKRNIHFYINKCGFHAAEFSNKFHPDPNEENPEDEGGEMFMFEKQMRHRPPQKSNAKPIETERLILRPFRAGDERDLFSYLHNPSVHCFLDMVLETEEDAKKALAERMADTSGLYVAIELKDSGKVIGEIFSDPEATDPIEATMDTFSPCWMLNSEYQRYGYMFEAVSAYYDYLFAEWNARRIYIYTEDYNVPCQKLCQKLGMRKEGEFKEFVSFIKDKCGKPIYENTWQYAILKDEWLLHRGV